MSTINDLLIHHVKIHGTEICRECRSRDLDYYNRVYIKGETFPFPFCTNCGLIQWQIMPGFHLSLEKLYEMFIQLAEEFGMTWEETFSGLEFIKKRKGDEGYSDDVAILSEIFKKISV